MIDLIHIEGAEYEICGDGCCVLRKIVRYCPHFRVPSSISTCGGEKYRVTKISSKIYFVGGSANIISFDESSEITWVSLWFIGCCRSTFVLPPRVKRVIGSSLTKFPKIVSENCDQRFVSTPGSRVIMNHFPLEVAYQHSHRQRFIIRESVRFVGVFSFYRNEIITSVVIPSSVEYIGDFSFCWCKNLRYILFKKNSRLKIIGKYSFESTSLESVEIPSSVEELRDNVFIRCRSLRAVLFQKGSNLKIIGKCSFCSTSLESVEFPSNVEEIGDYAFSDCLNLRSVHYLNEAKIRKIGEYIFYNCPNLNH